MNDLNPSIFLTPAIALVVVVLLYRVFSKKVPDKSAFKRYIFIITCLAFLLNLVWELVQGPLYKVYTNDTQHISFCALASLADVIMVLLLYFGFALIFRDALWAQKLIIRRILPVMMAGGAGDILAEIRHLSAGNWAYAESMPIIPVVQVGLSPVLQFTILPMLIYYLSFHINQQK